MKIELNVPQIHVKKYSLAFKPFDWLWATPAGRYFILKREHPSWYLI